MYLNVSLSTSYIPMFLISCPHFYRLIVSTIAVRLLCFAYWRSSDMAWTSDNLHRLLELICLKQLIAYHITCWPSYLPTVLMAVAAHYWRTISQIVFKELSLGINSPIGDLLLGEYHKDQYWVLYCITSILMTYFSLVCHPKSVHMLMIPRSFPLAMILH